MRFVFLNFNQNSPILDDNLQIIFRLYQELFIFQGGFLFKVKTVQYYLIERLGLFLTVF